MNGSFFHTMLTFFISHLADLFIFGKRSYLTIFSLNISVYIKYTISACTHSQGETNLRLWGYLSHLSPIEWKHLCCMLVTFFGPISYASYGVRHFSSDNWPSMTTKVKRQWKITGCTRGNWSVNLCG